jgi:Ca2+/Na+ antiporter
MSFFKNISDEFLKDIKTNGGKLYIIGAIIAFISFTFGIIDAVNAYKAKEKIHKEIFISFLLLSFSLLLKLYYLKTKPLAFINALILCIGFLIPAIIYLITYIKYK